SFWRIVHPTYRHRGEFGDGGNRLAAVEGPGEFAEQSLPRPAGGQVDADAAGSLMHASAKLEQSRTQSLNLCRAPRLRKLQQAKQVDQVVGKAMQEQTEGVGQEAVTAEPVGVKAVLELLDAVFALAPVVVKDEDLASVAGTVGDEEAQISSSASLLGLVA